MREDVELGKLCGRLIFAIPFRNVGVEEYVERKLLGRGSSLNSTLARR